MAVVKIYGIEVEANCAELLEIVVDFAGSDYSHKREQADLALEKLGKRGCVSALKYLVKKFSGSDYQHRRSVATRALELM